MELPRRRASRSRALPGADVGGDVGDGDPDDVAARVFRVVVGVGEDGVVVVAGIRGVDGDEGELTKVLALAKREGLRAGGFGAHGFGELVRNAVLVDGDERDGFRGGGVAEAGDDACAGEAVRAAVELLGFDELALAGAGAVAGRDQPVAIGALVDRGDAAAGLALVVDADDPAGAHADAADDAGGERRVGTVEGGEAAEQAVAGPERRIIAACEDEDARRGGPIRLPFERLGPEVPLCVGSGDAEDEDGGKRAFGTDAAALLLDLAGGGHLGEEALQLDLRGALEAERAGDVALRGLGRVLAQEGEDLLGAGEAVHDRPLPRGPGAGTGKIAGAVACR